jgi:quinol monooxygenase YgiN
MSRVLLCARVVPRISSRLELLQALLEWAAAARVDPGAGGPAVNVNVYEDVEHHSTFAMHGEWPSPAALNAHVRSDPFGALLGAVQLLAHSVRLSVGEETVEYGLDPLTVIRGLREVGGPADR